MVETTPDVPGGRHGGDDRVLRVDRGFVVHAYDDGFAFVRYEDVSAFDLDLRRDLDVWFAPQPSGASRQVPPASDCLAASGISPLRGVGSDDPHVVWALSVARSKVEWGAVRVLFGARIRCRDR